MKKNEDVRQRFDAARFTDALEVSGLTPQTIAKTFKVGPAIVGRWALGESIPSMKSLEKMRLHHPDIYEAALDLQPEPEVDGVASELKSALATPMVGFLVALDNGEVLADPEDAISSVTACDGEIKIRLGFDHRSKVEIQIEKV